LTLRLPLTWLNLPGFTLPGSKLPGLTLPLPGSSLPGSGVPVSTPPGSTPPGSTPPGSTPPGGTSGSTPAGQAGSLVSNSFTNAAGTRNYQVYVPSSYKAGTAMPLVVALHGCTEQIDVFRQLTALDKLAESKGFIVVFPGQTPSANQQSCWNWFKSGDIQRDSGEASIIAGLTQAIQKQYSIDTKRTYVLGFSAGGAMATVMGASYPDLYAAVGSGSGCEYNGLPCVGSPGPDAVAAGKAAYQAMGSHARSMPVIVFQGDADTTVVPENANRVVREWQTTNDLADDGSINGSIPLAPTSTSNQQVSGGHSYTVTTYGNGHGGELIQYWVVHGMNHAWSGGCSCQSYADPAGPNESQAMVDFFLQHSLP
jgi:poly(hydroxyalkanoate) depolymerase family esterase